MNRGSTQRDALIVIALLFGLFLLWVVISFASRGVETGGLIGTFSTGYLSPIVTSQFERDGAPREASLGEYDPAEDGQILTIDGRSYIRSPYYGQISIGRGNARQVYQPREEYITLTTSRRNQSSIDITGWLLENGDGNKLQRVGSGTFVEGRAVRVAIPQGTVLLQVGQAPIMGPVVLNPGDRAIVTTGALSGRDLVNASFRTNKCSGYLENITGANFTPRLSRNCPLADARPEAGRLEDACYSYLSRLRRCHTPEMDPYVVRDRRDGNYVVSHHLDRQTGFSNQCLAYAERYLNYSGCVRAHVNDSDFLENEWRIYLNRPFELWGESREVITLYDNHGRLVDQLKY